MPSASDLTARSDSDQLIQELANRVGSLGVEVADIAGHLEDLSTRVSGQAAQFEELHQSTETMVAGNREIDRAAREAQLAAAGAGAEIAESRSLIGRDPVWNAAHCRNRRLFKDRAVQKVARNTKPFLLQTYRRDMGGGNFVLLKDLSAPIWVRGRHWGAFRVGYRQ